MPLVWVQDYLRVKMNDPAPVPIVPVPQSRMVVYTHVHH